MGKQIRWKIDRKLLYLFIICLFTETVIFNMNSWRILDRSRYERKSFSVEQMETTGFEVTGNILTYVRDYGEEASITIRDIGVEVGTLYLDMYLPNEKYLAYTLYYTDEANGCLMRKVSREYVPEVERTKWVTCSFSGKTEELKIVFDLDDDLYQMAIDACVVNEPVKFRFCVLRFLLLYLTVAGIYLIRNYEYFREPMKRSSQQMLLCACTAVVLLVLWNLYAYSVDRVRLAEEKGDMYSQMLTDALLDGRTSLDVELSDALSALDNPYDDTEREAEGLVRDEDYIMDAAYYQGNYYVYFGVIPALLFFVPFKWMTGMYLSTGLMTFLLFGIYLIFLNMLMVKSIRKTLPDTPFGLYIMGILLLDAGSVAFCFVSRARFYEVVYGAGLAFAAIGLYLLVSVFWKVKKNPIQIFLGGLFLAMAVGCRPTMILYSFLLIPYLTGWLSKKQWKTSSGYLAVLLIPYVMVAAGLMWYNAVRFGSVFDFGQNYQLTVTDMAKDSYKLSTLPLCLWFGMFQPFSFMAQFPFVASGNAGNDFVGYFYNAGNVIPMFSSVPLLYTLFLPVLWRKWRKDHSTFSMIMMGTVTGLGWLMAVLVFVSAGVHIRYTAEAIPFFMVAAILLCCNYIRSQNEEIRKNLVTVFFAVTVFSVLVAFLLGIVGERDWTFTQHPEFYFSVERAFSFWK